MKKNSCQWDETRLMQTLIDMRMLRRLTQRDIAIKMKVEKSKVSRMESSYDRCLYLGDIMKYAEALGVNMNVWFDDPKLPNDIQIKKNVSSIYDLLEKLMTLKEKEKNNDSLCEMIKRFYADVLVPLLLPPSSSLTISLQGTKKDD